MKINDIVWHYGYEFRVVRVWPTAHGLRFVGVCTDNPVNDPIRHLGYNGAEYSKSSKEKM